MLVIRSAQVKALRDSILLNLETQALAGWPEADRPSSVEIRQAMSRAQTYGLLSREQLSRFLTVGRKLGVDFDLAQNCAWASELLNDADLSAALKISMVEDRARVRE